MSPSTTTTTTTTRRLLRGEITYSAAKELETNILHSHFLETVVAHHLNLVPTSCRIAEPSEWLSGSFNVCIPIYVEDNRRRPSFLLRFPLPHRVGENVNPGNADEKILCEVGTYTWLQHDCPEVPIPQLHGYGLSTGQKFTALENLPFSTRSVEVLRRHILRFLGFPVPSKYVAHSNKSRDLLGVGYLLIDYIDMSRGRMLSASWDQGRHNPRLRMNLFRSLSDIMLAMTRTPLPGIGSFIVDEKGYLRLRNRPLTLEIQDLENQHVPVDIPREFTHNTVDSYVSDILAFHESRLHHQLNAVNDFQDALFQMAGLTVMRAVRNLFFRPDLRRGPFYMSLTDLHQSNIFVDDDWNITNLVDLEWACSRPAEMIHPPYWLSNQSVDGIDSDAYESLHSEFMQAFAEQISKRSWQDGDQSYSILQEGWTKGTFWYALALDSPTGLFRIFYDHIQPRFSKDHINDAAFFKITIKYWAFNATRFIQKRVKDKEEYDRLLLEAFEQASPNPTPTHK
ncbi:uncharacterized protein BO95DRAFT_472928 [Aspergillus brunneoviolaceus CBS 621.78]|uniref:Uncharacterized protein n=1 Tax=Aspergillus brunneoviolaceus CBS 621.78 TaxID=1450534 RepID=A0ACD1GB67_9EURO|nr:hypothetical protein BO95DRAFT_472928 [Aspergillus brunneoviolaceus CBS 621.78]RAH46494.1 hypothetical protein BO95DRAFT_472928 [Aspergillus brunneoviolaceus CBS 621.78]